MTPAQADRWQKIQALQFTPPDAVIDFEMKLVQHTGWTRPQASRAIDEYRRFLLLAAEAGHPVSPSPIVDEVWHLHLLYTRSYWEQLCPHVLGRPLHHEPATGAPADRDKLDDWYARTLASYRAIFDDEPPAAIWPDRPGKPTIRRIDTASHTVLPRQAFTWLLGSIAVVCGLLAAAVAGIILLASRAAS